MGSAVDPADLTRELDAFKSAGIGGVHVIPIYAAVGYESRARTYLSPEWMAALDHVIAEAARLGLGVDMSTGSGWCFGGPAISEDHAAARLVTDARTAHGGEPFEATYDAARLDALVAVATDGRREDLRPRVSPGGALKWTPPAGAWRVYALASRPSIKVKRAAPGGEGWMLDPFSPDAMREFLAPFHRAFDQRPAAVPRAMYHDSFEYAADWSRGLLAAFARRRGYRLEDELPAFIDGTPGDRAARVKHDYRQTLDELLVDETFPEWTAWSHAHGMITRNEAHGAPANLLDFYALADVPETEMFRSDRDTRVSRVAASAAHVAGRRLVSAETGTWIAEHFHETLAGLKDLVDQLFVAGVNHVFYHGTAYSPGEAPWPGWVFYAATEMNPRNAIWRDVPALNAYITRVQTVLQAGAPDQDVLVYWPIHDLWSDARGTAMPLTVHDPAWLEGQPVGAVARRLDALGITYDFVSDRQLATASAAEGTVRLPGGRYARLVIPRTTHMPPETFGRLITLARGGATIVFDGALPGDVPGFEHLDERRRDLAGLLRQVRFDPSISDGVDQARLGSGHVLAGAMERALDDLPREHFEQAGLEFIRRRDGASKNYFVANRSGAQVRTWVRLSMHAGDVLASDPMTGRSGRAVTRQSDGATAVFVSLALGESVLLRTMDSRATGVAPYRSWRPAGPPVPLPGPWSLRFIEGGPDLPAPREHMRLGSWTDDADPPSAAFAGTAVYRTTFDAPDRTAHAWLLDLGAVHESARVRLNGRDLGTLIGPDYRLALPSGSDPVGSDPFEWDRLRLGASSSGGAATTSRLDGRVQPASNVLEIEVTNLSANRLRDLDRRKVSWRVFHDINVVNLDYQPLDASNWPILPSGLLGPVTLTPAADDAGQ